MNKFLNFLPRLALILAILLLVAINLSMAYIMFAPDTLPKPFYLMYALPPEPAPKENPENAGSVLQPPPAHAAATAEPDQASADPAGTPSPLPQPLPEVKPGQGIMLDTGTKIVNLVDPTGRRYLRVGIVLEFAPQDPNYSSLASEEKTAFTDEFIAEINGKLPVINDILITCLSVQTFESIYSADGKETLREKIMETINTQIPENRVVFVYFTEFVVQ